MGLDGYWHVDSGTYATYGHRDGQLGPSDHSELVIDNSTGALRALTNALARLST